MACSMNMPPELCNMVLTFLPWESVLPAGSGGDGHSVEGGGLTSMLFFGHWLLGGGGGGRGRRAPGHFRSL